MDALSIDRQPAYRPMTDYHTPQYRPGAVATLRFEEINKLNIAFT